MSCSGSPISSPDEFLVSTVLMQEESSFHNTISKVLVNNNRGIFRRFVLILAISIPPPPKTFLAGSSQVADVSCTCDVVDEKHFLYLNSIQLVLALTRRCYSHNFTLLDILSVSE